MEYVECADALKATRVFILNTACAGGLMKRMNFVVIAQILISPIVLM